MKYIVTFYAHFGAIRFKNLCAKEQVSCQLRPVPRDLSSSCGTCALCDGRLLDFSLLRLEEIEQIVECTEQGYRTLYEEE